MSIIWKKIQELDIYINKERPWEKNLSESHQILRNLLIGSEVQSSILQIAKALEIFLPETAEKIEKQFKGPKIKNQKPLFPRI